MSVRRLAALALVACTALTPLARRGFAATPLDPAPLALATSPATGSSAHQSRTIPKNDGWVTDLAGILTPEEERDLEASMEAYKRGSGHDIALLTVPSLGGDALEDFSHAVARDWKLGDPQRNDGALLVVARDERKLRIEVGDGLEGSLTDARCARIIRDTITPLFRRQRFAEGLAAGIAAMQEAAGGLPEGARRSIPQPATRDVSLSIGELACPIAMFVFALLLVVMLRRLGKPWFFESRPRRGWFLGGPTIPFGGFGGSSRGFGGGGGFSGFGGGGRFSGGGSSGGW